MSYTTNCAEDYSKRRRNLSTSTDKKDWWAQRAWTVFSNDPASRTTDVTPTPLPGNDPLPSFRDPHPQYPFLLCDKGTVAATENPTFWEISYSYSFGFNFVLELDPLLQPPRWRFLIGQESLPCFFDKDGNPIVNSAGDFFDPQPQDVWPILSIKITRNEATYDANKALQYLRSTNSDAWVLPNGQVVQPGQAKMHSIEQGQEVDKNSRYVPVTYVADLTDTDWNLAGVDKGYQAWDTAQGDGTATAVKEKIYTNPQPGTGLSKTLSSSETLLDGTGAPLHPADCQLGLNDGDPAANPNALSYITRVIGATGAVGLKFKQLKLRSFNALALV